MNKISYIYDDLLFRFKIKLNDYIEKYDVITGQNYILTQPETSTNVNLFIFAINYNILRFISGMAGLAYV